jgi:hypothetical protein
MRRIGIVYVQYLYVHAQAIEAIKADQLHVDALNS